MSDQRQFSVNLTARTYSCVQDTGIPCGHVIMAINTVKQAPMDFMPFYWSRQDWVAAYDSAMPPITIDMVHELFLSQEREHQQPSMEGEATQVRVEDENSDGNEEGPEGARGIAAVGREAMQCEPPLTRVPRGRPAKKRMNKGEMRRKLEGHNMGGLLIFLTGPRHVAQPVKALVTTHVHAARYILAVLALDLVFPNKR
jgi:hypothetical protein